MKAILVGASSGIGAAMARQLVREGHTVGLMARRLDRLQQLQSELGDRCHVRPVDVAQPAEAMPALRSFIDELGGADLIVLSAGIGFLNPELDWQPEADTIAVNVTGIAALANVALHHFQSQGHGRLVGISSIAGLRGSSVAPAYNASKAFLSNYLEGLRAKVARRRLPITITDVRPGFVDTAMAQGEGQFWVAPPEKAAAQILRAVQRKRRVAYVTRRWTLVAALLRRLPAWLHERIG